MKSPLIDYAPNTGPPLTEVYAFISRDASGRENTIGHFFQGTGMVQLMTGNPTTFALFRDIVRKALPDLEANGQTVHLLKFTTREEVPF